MTKIIDVTSLIKSMSNAEDAEAIYDVLRFQLGHTYEQIIKHVAMIRGISEDDARELWEGYMQELD